MSASPWMSRNGGSSDVAWVTGEASRARRISEEFSASRRRVRAPSMSDEATLPGLVKSDEVARATTHCTFELIRFILLSSLDSLVD